MAGRKKSSGGDGIILLAVVVVFAVVVLTPIILLYGWFKNFKLSFKITQVLNNNPVYFWLDQVQKEKFLTVASHLSASIRKMEDANNEAVKAGISQNKNGRWSARSHLGKKVCSIIDQCTIEIEELTQEYNHYRYLPREKWEKWSEAYIKERAFKRGFIFWLFSILPVTLIFSDSFFKGLYHFLAFPILAIISFFSDNKILQDSDFKMVVTATVVAIAAFFVEKFLSRNKPEEISSQPPVVSVENVNTYEWERISQRVKQLTLGDLDKLTLKNVVMCALMISRADDDVDKNEMSIIRWIVDSHWKSNWDSKDFFIHNIFEEQRSADVSKDTTELIHPFIKHLSLHLSNEQKACFEKLMLMIILSDGSVDQSESEIWHYLNQELHATPAPENMETKEEDMTPEPVIPAEQRFRVVFFGETIEGIPKNIVMEKLSQSLKVDHKRIERMFAEGKKIIKKEVNFETGQKIIEMFKKAGAICRLESIHGS
jgi:uncharacterized tellurite resistance protein B-like protein